MNFTNERKLIKTFLQKSKRTSRNLLVSMIAVTSILGAMSVSGNALTNVALQSVQARTKKSSKKHIKKHFVRKNPLSIKAGQCIVSLDPKSRTLHIKAGKKGNKLELNQNLETYILTDYEVNQNIGVNDPEFKNFIIYPYKYEVKDINQHLDMDLPKYLMHTGIEPTDIIEHISIDSNITIKDNKDYAKGEFSDFHYLKDILGLDKIDVSRVTNMSTMFTGDYSLQSLDLSNWDVSRAADMSNMFSYDYSLSTLNINGWDTSHVTDMYRMFYKCSRLSQIKTTNNDPQNDLGTKHTDKESMFMGDEEIFEKYFNGNDDKYNNEFS